MDHLLNFFKNIRWQDFLDIALKQLHFVQALRPFQGNERFSGAREYCHFLDLQQACPLSGLVVTSWVIQGITLVAAVIIVVIFRNEIRAVLQAKNLKSILWGFHEAEKDHLRKPLLKPCSTSLTTEQERS